MTAPIGRARVITVSTRAQAGTYADRSGPEIVRALLTLGFSCGDPEVVADGEPVGVALTEAIADHFDVVITSGGTGLSPTDRTPEQTSPLLTATLPHLAAAIARYGVDHGVPTAVLSRGLAGVAGRTLIINVPGSVGGAKDAMVVLSEVLVHAVAQLRGEDHRPGAAPVSPTEHRAIAGSGDSSGPVGRW